MPTYEMPIQNDHLPANHQDIDNIPADTEDTHYDDEIQYIISLAEKATASTSTQSGAIEQKQVTLGEIQLALANAQDRVKSIQQFIDEDWKEYGMTYYDSTDPTFVPQTFQPIPYGFYPVPGDPNKVMKPVEIPDLSESLPETLAQLVLDNPASVNLLDKPQLAFAYEALDAKVEELESAKSVVKDTIFSLMDTDSEEVGNYLALKVTKPVFKTLTLEQAKELGLTKVEEKIDNALVKKAWKAGAKVGEVEFDVMNVMRKKQAENVEETL